jgi:hypothetical protein
MLGEADGSADLSSRKPVRLSGRRDWLLIAAVGVAIVGSAIAFWTLYDSTGDFGQVDQVYFNGTALGPTTGLGNDIARGYTGNYDSELHSFDVKNYLQGTNSVLYSIDQSVLGGTGESTLHADWAMLTVTHATPEPATLGLLALGAVAIVRGRRQRS